jgi:hypothetical protein
VLHDRFTMNGFITLEATLDGYRQASKKLRLEALKGVAFLRTWCNDKGKGVATTCSTEASQRIGEVLVEMEASDR